MPKYLETSDALKKLFNEFMEQNELSPETAVDLAHIVNLSVRCCPRAVHGTVRKNIVSIATSDFCRVNMTKEMSDTGYQFNKIHIRSKEVAAVA